MAVWFVSIALLGVWGIIKHPAVLLGLDPRYAISYLAHDGFKAFAVLGGVFLCVTGAEALYADMGHFGATPIRLAWSAIVFPSLVLNYAGQAAIVLADGVTADNIFYRLCPAPLLMPMIVLATVATVIASRGVFDDPAGDPAWLVPAAQYHADLGGGLRRDLCRPGELAIDGRHHRADRRLRQIR
jgi:KUP system potassium uptake protein